MIVDLRTIPHGSRDFEFLIGQDGWRYDKQEDQILAFDAPLQAKIRIYRAVEKYEKYLLEGDISGGLQVRCDRCLEPYHHDLRSHFRVFLALPVPEMDEAEVELVEEDLEVNFIRGEKIDLDEVIREQIYLSLSMKSLCSEHCSGLCPICGRNLNEGECQCHREQGHPGFLKLKNLKTQRK